MLLPKKSIRPFRRFRSLRVGGSAFLDMSHAVRVRVDLPLDENGYTELIWHCSGWIDAHVAYRITLLLETRCADPNQRDLYEGGTALMWLAYTYHEPKHRAQALRVLKALLANGADVNAVCNAGYSALHYACSCPSDLGVVTALVEAGADVGLRNREGLRPMDLHKIDDGHPAAPARHAAIVQYLHEVRAQRLRRLIERWRRAAFVVGTIARFVRGIYVEVSYRPGGVGATRAREEFEAIVAAGEHTAVAVV